MQTTRAEFLEALRSNAAETGIFLDFDGTLAEIVAHPSMAGPIPGAITALTALWAYRTVAIVSGRPTDELRALVGITTGVTYVGSYGLEGTPVAVETIAGVRAVADAIPGAWVEPKGASIAIHYRDASDPASARSGLEPRLEALAERHGLELIEGKMVWELVPAGTSRKGGAVERLIGTSGARRALYAGDDLPDLEAFDSLERALASGALLSAVKVAVHGSETPPAVSERADIVVEGPAGLVELLGQLV